MSNKQKHQIISWTAVILWMMLTFILSAQTGNQSGQLSAGITKKVVEAIKIITHKEDFNLDTFNHIVRKCAHFMNYLVLALLVLNALRKKEKLKVKNVIFTFVICALYASSDEYHQLFVPGRGPQVRDVFIDSSGAVVGIGIYLLLYKKFSDHR